MGIGNLIVIVEGWLTRRLHEARETTVVRTRRFRTEVLVVEFVVCRELRQVTWLCDVKVCCGSKTDNGRRGTLVRDEEKASSRVVTK